MSHGPVPEPVDDGDDGDDGDGDWPVVRLHCWLLWPLQVQRMIFVPLAVPAPFASRQSPDWTPVIVPPAFTLHCWLGCPLQSQMMTAVPGLVPCPEASRHLLPYTVNCLADV